MSDIIEIPSDDGDDAGVTVKDKSLEKELSVIDKEIADISSKIRKYEERRRLLKRKAEMLREKIQQRESDALLEMNWERKNFAWSAELDRAREKVFQLPDYRADQLAVINASMAGHDCVLIMPTGGGKR